MAVLEEHLWLAAREVMAVMQRYPRPIRSLVGKLTWERVAEEVVVELTAGRAALEEKVWLMATRADPEPLELVRPQLTAGRAAQAEDCRVASRWAELAAAAALLPAAQACPAWAGPSMRVAAEAVAAQP
jgi:hypothetical protein